MHSLLFYSLLAVFVPQIDKFGDPNGIVQFTEQDLKEHVYSEPSDSDGPLSISVLITRREGVMGNITVGKHLRFHFSLFV